MFEYSRQRTLLLRRTKRLVEFVIYGIFDYLALKHISGPSRAQLSTRVAIVNLKFLGDYFLWLPYAQTLVRCLGQQGSEVVLIVSEEWSSIAKFHLKGCEVIGVERRRFLRNWNYRAATLRQLRRLGVAQVLQTGFPRDTLVEDAIVRALGGEAFGVNEGYLDRPRIDLWFGNRLYSKLLHPLSGVHHSVQHEEFLRFIGVDGDIEKLNNSYGEAIEPVLGESYFVVSPGASKSYKRWPIEKMAMIACRALHADPDLFCVLTGTSTEQGLCDLLAASLPAGRFFNLCGQTSLIGFVDLIANAQWVFGNDSSAGHIAAAYGVPSVILLGGGQFNRCYPYPRTAPVKKCPQCIWHSMPCFGCDWICRYSTPTDQAYPCVDQLEVEKVWNTVQKVMGQVDGAEQRLP